MRVVWMPSRLALGVQSVDLLVAKIKSSELEGYGTLDKFVGWR
jgi:hypothetical protein